MSFAVVINGEQLLANKLKELEDPTKIKQAVMAGALMVEKSAKESIAHGSKSGRTYFHNRVAHQASAPGQAPATDDGALVSSIQHWLSSDGMSAAVGTKLKYGTYLEYGTRKMEPRPFMGPALDINREAIIKRITEALKESK